MRKSNIALYLAKLLPVAVLALLRLVGTRMSGNQHFLTPVVAPADMLAKADVLERAIGEATNGSRQSKLQRNIELLESRAMLTAQADYVRGVCLGDAAKLEEFCQLLRALPPGFNLKLHDWKKDHWCAQAKAAEVKEMLGHYTPGNHWLHVQRQLPKEDAVAMGADAEAWVRSSLLALLPVYHFTLWDPS